MKFIYGLYDDRGRIRYIGLAANPQARARGHWKMRFQLNHPKSLWLRTLSKPPRMRVLVVVEDNWAMYAERSAIAAARRKFGHRQILNSISGPTNMRFYTAMTDPGFLARRSEQSRLRWQDPEYRARQAAARERYVKDPDWIATMTEINRKHSQDPEYRAKLAAAKRGNTNARGSKRTPEQRAQISKAVRANWADPEYRARQAALMKGNTRGVGNSSSPEAKAKISKASKALWNNPEYRAKMAARPKRRSLSPEERAQASARMKAINKARRGQNPPP